jgi:hypothetical protein
MRFWRKRQIRLYKYQGGGKRMYLSAASLPAGEAGNMVVWVFQEQITQFHLRGGIWLKRKSIGTKYFQLFCRRRIRLYLIYICD